MIVLPSVPSQMPTLNGMPSGVCSGELGPPTRGAGCQPDDGRWQSLAPTLAADLVRQNPLELDVWAPIFDPLGRPLADAVRGRYRDLQAKLRSADLDTPQLAAVDSEFDLAANLLARYAADRPEILTDLLLTADDRHVGRFFELAMAHRPVIPKVAGTPASESASRMSWA